MTIKQLLIASFILISFSNITAQFDSIAYKSNAGFYFGIESIMASLDRWEFERNDLDIEQATPYNTNDNLKLGLFVGYKFEGNFSTEASYRRKEYSHGIGLMQTQQEQHQTYSANLITLKLKYDQNLLQEKMIISPSIGMTIGSLGDDKAEQSTIDVYTRRPIFHRESLMGIELGLELDVKITKGLKLRSQFFLLQGIDNVVTVRMDLTNNTTFNHSRLVSDGSTIGFVLGLRYDLYNTLYFK